MTTVTEVVAVTDGTASSVDASGIGKTSLITVEKSFKGGISSKKCLTGIKIENSLGTAGTAHSANTFLVGQTVGGSGTGGWWIATSNFSVSD